MSKSLWQQLKPHVIAIGIFFLVSCLYCLPAFKGLVLNQPDVIGWKGMAQHSFDFKEKHGHLPLWTNSTFSGMPAFQIAMESKHNIILAQLNHLFTLFLPSPADLFFLSCIGFYILCVVLRLNTWVSVFAAIGYSFASYSAVIVAVGHTPKFASMGYAPAVLAGLILLTQRKYVLGFAATLLFTSLMLFQNHIQIVYYTMITAVCLSIAFVINALKRKEVKHVLTCGALALVAGVISAISYAVILLPLNEYAKETMRGGRSELTQVTSANKTAANKTKGGLDKEYAFNWSYGISESMTVILPAYRGGSSGSEELNEDGKAAEALQNAQLPGDAVSYFFNFLSAYWGDQPGTSGPVYLGALVCLFFIAGLFVLRGWHVGWIVAATVLGFVLSWGSNFKAINYFLFDYLPFYNKFRAPSMALVIPQLTFPLLAAMGLQQIFYGEENRAVLLKRLKYALFAVGAVLLVALGTYFTADFKSNSDRQVREGIASTLTQAMTQGREPSQEIIQQSNTVSASVVGGLVQDRKSLYSRDLIRMILFLALGIGIVWLVVQKKVKPLHAVIGLCAINIIDLIAVDSRYLNTSKYIDKEELESVFVPNRVDLAIKQDTSYYRVFNTMGDPFQSSAESAHTSYLHNSVGGYHPAKLALYDDLISRQLRNGNMRIYNMLNAKYFIVSNPADRQPAVQQNPDALGPAWLIKTIKYVNNADEEMLALDSLNPKDTVVIDKRERSKIPFTPAFDSTASIQLVQNLNDKLTYRFNAGANQLVVFSEIYYPHGWKAFIDNKEAPIARVNYVLRGLAVPAGNHAIELRFEPRSYFLGDRLSLIVGIISYLLLIAALVYEWRNYRRNKTPVRTETKQA